jgi:hypothetical protein
MSNEEVMVIEDLFEVDGTNLFTDGDNHEAKSWREWTAHGTASALLNTFLAQCKRLHIQR